MVMHTKDVETLYRAEFKRQIYATRPWIADRPRLAFKACSESALAAVVNAIGEDEGDEAAEHARHVLVAFTNGLSQRDLELEPMYRSVA